MHPGHVLGRECVVPIERDCFVTGEETDKGGRAARLLDPLEQTLDDPGPESRVSVIWMNNDVLDVEVVHAVPHQAPHADYCISRIRHHYTEQRRGKRSWNSLLVEVVTPADRCGKRAMFVGCGVTVDHAVLVRHTTSLWLRTPGMCSDPGPRS